MDWRDLKELLGLSFSDQRNSDCLVQELIALKLKEQEFFFAFGNVSKKTEVQFPQKQNH